MEALPPDAAALSAEDGDVNPAALLRLQRCRQPALLPGLADALFGTLRRDSRLERLKDAGGKGHAMAPGGGRRGQKARHVQGRRQGMSEGMSHERALLRRQAAQRFGVATGDALAVLLVNEEDVERLAEVGDLVVGCTSAEELLRRGGGLLNGGR